MDRKCRKTFRFSLQGLLIAVAVCAIVMSWAGFEIRRFSRQRVAIAVIRGAGGRVTTRTAGPGLLRILLGESLFQQAETVTFADRNKRSFTDESLFALGRLTDLSSLEFRNVAISDAELEKLSSLSKLSKLVLERTNINGAGLSHLSCQGRLTGLYFRGSPIDSRAIGFITNCPRLMSLDLSATNIADNDAQRLKSLPLLHELDLSHTGVTDASVEDLLNGDLRPRVINVTNTFVSLNWREKYPNRVQGGPPAPNEQLRLIRRDLSLHGVRLWPQSESWYVEFSENWMKTNVNEDLELLTKVKDLRTVTFRGRSIDDDVVSKLPRLNQLSELLMLRTAITDVGLRHLGKGQYHSVRYLSLVEANISATGLGHLAGLPCLETLNLERSAISDEDLMSLANIPQLRRLGLAGTGISDAGLIHLQNLLHLRSVDLAETRVTEAGVMQLMNALPDLFVSR